MKLSIIIPVYNEINLLPKILIKIVERTKSINKEIIIIDDFSNDGTREWLKKLKNKKKNIIKRNKTIKNIKIIFKKNNEGKGSAVKLGIKECRGEVIVIQDSDLEYDPKDFNKMIKKIENENFDVVYGNRFSSKKNKYHYLIYAIGNFFLSSFVSIIFNKKLFDVAVCYKMFKKKVIQDLKLDSNDFMFDFEFTSKILKQKKWNITQLDIFYKGRTFKEGKKISWLDGFKALLIILKIKFFD
tara:strand:- start:1921 stop:2646 length:726 start_codon:yes stop_codon:yes gene_type:complete